MLDSNKLLGHMKSQGKTSKDLADALGLSMSTIYRKLNGKSAFTIGEVQKCMDTFGLSPSDTQAIFFAHFMS